MIVTPLVVEVDPTFIELSVTVPVAWILLTLTTDASIIKLVPVANNDTDVPDDANVKEPPIEIVPSETVSNSPALFLIMRPPLLGSTDNIVPPRSIVWPARNILPNLFYFHLK